MGKYINPPTQTKESWLMENAELIEGAPFYSDESTGNYTICLVNNGAFKAAAVAFDEEEFRAFSRSEDVRPKDWYTASRFKVDQVAR